MGRVRRSRPTGSLEIQTITSWTFAQVASSAICATHNGKKITWESLYREIVTDERIVYTSVLAEDDTVATVSLTTIELVHEGDGTQLVLV